MYERICAIRRVEKFGHHNRRDIHTWLIINSRPVAPRMDSLQRPHNVNGLGRTNRYVLAEKYCIMGVSRDRHWLLEKRLAVKHFSRHVETDRTKRPE
jgi:hypothetical protein